MDLNSEIVGIATLLYGVLMLTPYFNSSFKISYKSMEKNNQYMNNHLEY